MSSFFWSCVSLDSLQSQPGLRPRSPVTYVYNCTCCIKYYRRYWGEMKGKTWIDDCKYFFCHFESLSLFELGLQISLFWLQVLQNVVGCKLKVENSRESFEEIYHLKRILLNGFCFDRITCLLRSLFSFALTRLDFLIPSMCLMMLMMGLN